MAKDEYANKKADSLVATLLALGRVGLLLLGIIGIAYELFRTDGLLKRWLASLLSSSGGFVVAVLIAIALYLAWRWVNAAPDGNATRRGDIPLYGMMTVGAYFLYRLLSNGTL